MPSGLQPLRQLKSLNGKSSPYLVLFNDDSKCVVKFKNNPKGTRVLVNEYVVAELAQLLSLPIAPNKILNISNDFIELHFHNPQLHFQSGNQFCSKYIEGCIGLPKIPPFKNEIVNRKDLVGLIIFDYWLCNSDRHRNNILLEPLSEEGYYVHLIDHSHCFPGSFKWSKASLNEGPKKLRNRIVHQWCASLLNERSELTTFVEKLTNLADTSIYHIIQSIPADWDVSQDERDALFTYLSRSKKRMPKIFNYIFKRYYSK